jgi:hypothetical protein
MEKSFLTQEVEMVNKFCNINIRIAFSLSLHGLEQLCPTYDKLRALISLSLSLSLSLQRLYSPGWASASFKSFLRPSRFRATIVQFLDPSLATSSTTPSSQSSLGLPVGRFPPGSLRRTLLDKSSSSWCMTCPAQLSLLSLKKGLNERSDIHMLNSFDRFL